MSPIVVAVVLPVSGEGGVKRGFSFVKHAVLYGSSVGGRSFRMLKQFV